MKIKIKRLRKGEWLAGPGNTGIYRGVGTLPYYGGPLKHGQPVAYGPGVWAGDWYRTKAEAWNSLKRLAMER